MIAQAALALPIHPDPITFHVPGVPVAKPDGRRGRRTEQRGAVKAWRPAAERFREGYDIVGECWIWRGAKSSKGYAYFRDDSGKKVSVHRFAYKRLVGPIPIGLVIDHLCKNPGCCNPAHLEAVTNRENVMRGSIGQIQKTVTHCKRGHEYSPENVWIEPNGGRRCKACARERGRVNDARRRARRRA